MADPRPPKTPERAKSNKKVGNGIVALSSAAVLTVYSAGYVRTRAAAERLEAAYDRRPELPGPREAGGSNPQRGANPFAEPAPQAQPALAPSIDAAAPAAPSAVVAATSAAAAPTSGAATAAIAPGAAPVAAAHADAPAAVTPTADGSDSVSTPVPSAVATAPVPPVAVVAKLETPTAVALPAAPLPAAPVSNAQSMERPPAAPVPAPAPAAPTGPAWAGPWKDGKYLGMGYSRHGDIQAQVVIENGRIAYAVIAKCLTRYTCSIIEHLQKQVSQRQSPEVDYVAAATESANAFYGAIVAALKTAK